MNKLQRVIALAKEAGGGRRLVGGDWIFTEQQLVAFFDAASAPNQPSAATENPEAMYNPVARESHAGASARQIDVAAGDQLAASQPERCCLDYPRCDCNSPEPDGAPALQPCGHPWKAQHDSKCILCSSPGVTP
jgi:hypothetical protein